MDLSVKHLFLFIFFVTVTAIFFLKPHQTSAVSKEGVPQAVFIDFKSFEIDKDGVTSVGEGALAKKFSTHLEIDSPKFIRAAKQGIESIESKRAIYKDNDSILFEDSVNLSRDDGWTIETDRLLYSFEHKRYTTLNNPFVITYGKSLFKGKGLVYYQREGKIVANDIFADISHEDL